MSIRWSVVLVLLSFIGASRADMISVPRADLSTTNPLDHAPIAAFFTGNATHIDFEGPWSAPDNVGSYFNLGAAGATYNAVGVQVGSGVGFIGGQPGFGYLSPNTVIGSTNALHNGPVEIIFVQPSTQIPATVPAAGIMIADGPTNKVTLSFYGLDNQLLGAISPLPQTVVFAGFSHDEGIHRMVATSSGNDDFYLDALVFTHPIQLPIPGAAFTALPALLAMITLRRRGI